MNPRTYRRNLAARFVMGLLVASCAMTARAAFAGEAEQTASGQPEATSRPTTDRQAGEKATIVPGHASGMTIYIDPQTGTISKEPAPGAVPLQLSPTIATALSTSDQGLIEVASPVPGGGFKIDLQGRFQSPQVATIDANGNVKILHLHEMPGSSK